MRFFMIYSNQWAVGNKPIGIASLAATLRKAGHVFELFDCTAYSIDRSGKIDLNHSGLKIIQFQEPSNPIRIPLRKKTTYEGLLQEVLASIDRFKPDIIGLSALTDDYPLGLRLMTGVKNVYPFIPTIAGGVHATVDPLGVISEDCFDNVCVGEGEHVVVDIADRIDQKRTLNGIGNLWVKSADGEIERNSVRPYEQNLDRFPFPDWTIYGPTAFYKPYDGYVYKYGDFEMSRGCPYKCSYCINVQLQEIYKMDGPAKFHREKTIDRVIEEIQYAIKEYQIDFLKFWDETFLLMSIERMQEFCDKYSSHIGLPYVIETTGESVTEFSAMILRKTNCKSVSIGMESGSPDIRMGVLHKPTGNEVYLSAYHFLEENGINKAAFNMLGLPNESQEDVFRTIGMNRLCGTFTQAVGIFYPYKGTPIRDMMVRENLMEEDFDLRNMKNYDFTTLTAGVGSVVKFKDMDGEVLNRLRILFSSYVYWPISLFPLMDIFKNNENAFSVTLLNNIQMVTYFKKFGLWPKSLPKNEDKKPSSVEIELALKVIQTLNDPIAVDFSSLLIEEWRGEGMSELTVIFEEIANGDRVPDFPLSEDPEELASWLSLNISDSNVLRKTRSDIRALARKNREKYSTGSEMVLR